jgi:hypothetical protein
MWIAPLTAGLAIASAATTAQVAPKTDPRSQEVGIVVTPIVSIQPEGPSGWPYLSNGLRGRPAGLLLGVQKRVSPHASLGAEVSTTLAFSATQSGRFISGPECYSARGCPTVVSTQRDTIVSFLPAAVSRWFELKAGPSAVYGATDQGTSGDSSYRTWSPALTAGLDGVASLGGRVSLVPTVRYHYVFRGPEREYAGLSRSILRLGLGVRFNTRGPQRPTT